MGDIVECHSGYKYGERPIALYWGDQRKEITKIVSRSQSPDGILFQVQTDDGQIYTLQYNDFLDVWIINQP